MQNCLVSFFPFSPIPAKVTYQDKNLLNDAPLKAIYLRQYTNFVTVVSSKTYILSAIPSQREFLIMKRKFKVSAR